MHGASVRCGCDLFCEKHKSLFYLSELSASVDLPPPCTFVMSDTLSDIWPLLERGVIEHLSELRTGHALIDIVIS